MNVESLLDEMGVEYYQTGERFMVCCPFHNDTNPSCGIWVDSGYFKCFACDEEGSFAEFMSEVEGIPIMQAVRRVRGQDSISDLEDSLHEYLDRTEKVLKYFSWKSFCATYPPVMPETRAWEYLVGRGLNEESIRRIEIRWGGDVGKFRYWVVLPIRTVEGKSDTRAEPNSTIWDQIQTEDTGRRSHKPPRRLRLSYKLLSYLWKNPRLLPLLISGGKRNATDV